MDRKEDSAERDVSSMMVARDARLDAARIRLPLHADTNGGRRVVVGVCVCAFAPSEALRGDAAALRRAAAAPACSSGDELHS